MPNSSRNAEFKVLILLFSALSLISSAINLYAFHQWTKSHTSSTFQNVFIFIHGVVFVLQIFCILFCLGKVPKGSLACSILAFICPLIQTGMLIFNNNLEIGIWITGWIFQILFSLFSMLMCANYALISQNGGWWEQT